MIKSIYRYHAFSFVRMFLYIVIPIWIIIQPVYFMDDMSLCIVQRLFGMKCLFCGMTRAFVHILHFDFIGAIHYNGLSLMFFPLICLIVIIDCINIIKSKKMS